MKKKTKKKIYTKLFGLPPSKSSRHVRLEINVLSSSVLLLESLEAALICDNNTESPRAVALRTMGLPVYVSNPGYVSLLSMINRSATSRFAILLSAGNPSSYTYLIIAPSSESFCWRTQISLSEVISS